MEFIENTLVNGAPPWVLVSELGQRDGVGVGVLWPVLCRGLMEEFKLLRTALGAAELLREWAAAAAAAPRKPERDTTEGAGGEYISGGAVESRRDILRANRTLPDGLREIILDPQLFNRNSIKLSSTRRQTRGKNFVHFYKAAGAEVHISHVLAPNENMLFRAPTMWWLVS